MLRVAFTGLQPTLPLEPRTAARHLAELGKLGRLEEALPFLLGMDGLPARSPPTISAVEKPCAAR
eukprot:7777815-Alexandrium_andersonii.AAC.1